MKRIMAFIIAFAMIMSAVPAMAADYFYDVTIVIDGKAVENAGAYIDNGTTWIEQAVLEDAIGKELGYDAETGYVALRRACEELGLTVSWTQETHTVTIASPVEEEIGNKYYVITNVGTGKKLAAVDFNKENNAQLTTVEGENNDDVTWRLGKMGEMKFNLSNAASGKSIDVPSASKEVGKVLITYTSNGGNNQCWNFEEVEEGVYMFRVDHSGLYMDASGDVLVQAEKTDSDYQKWTIEYVKDSMLARVLNSEGFKLISEQNQDGFKRYMFGSIPASYAVANSAESYFIENDFENAEPEVQAAMIKTVCAYTAYGQVTGDKKDRESAEYEIVDITVDENYDIWRGSREKVWIHHIEMEGDVEGQLHKFVMVSNEENSGMVKKMVEGLGCFPFAVRQHVRRLIWRKGDNANNYNGGGDTIWARLNFEPSAVAVINTLAHELGHVLDQKTIGDNRIWTWAAAMDSVPVSGYGSSNQAEDLAEFHRLYWTTFGKDTQEAVTEVYPYRSKVLKGLLYRADNVYYADFKVYDDYVKEIKAKIDAFGDEETAKKLSIDKYYSIKDKETNLAWTIEKIDNGARIILTEYTGADEQQFYVENFAGVVRIYSKKTDIPVQLHRSSMPGKDIIQYGGTWSVDDRFKLVEADGGYELYCNRYNLGAAVQPAGVKEDFVPYLGQEAESDVWVFEEAGNREGMKRYEITVGGKYLTGNPFGFTTEKAGDNTTWMLVKSGIDTFTIVNMGTGKAIDINGGSTAAGTKLITYDLSKNDNQLFFMEEVEGGYNLKMKHSELYLTVNEDGTITQEEKSADKVQVFAFTEIE